MADPAQSVVEALLMQNQTGPKPTDLMPGPGGYGLRQDLTQKGNGFFGPLTRPDGNMSSELSFGFNSGGKDVLAPLIVPTLSKDELDHLLSGAPPTQEIYNKAIQHALERRYQGKRPFANPNELYPLPQSPSMPINPNIVPNPMPSPLPVGSFVRG